MKRTLKTLIVTVGAAGILVTGAAFAQDATATPTTPDAAAEVQPTGRIRDRIANSEMAALVQEYTGLEAAAVREALVAGSTLADLITANGRTVEDFTAAALALYDANQDERRANFETRLTEMLNGDYRPFADGRGGRGGHRGGMFGGRGPADVIPADPAATEAAPGAST